MAKSKKTEAIKPTTSPIETDINEALDEQNAVFNKPDDWYRLVKIDDKGNTIKGSDFAVSQRVFRTSFEARTSGDSPNFKVVEEPKKKK